MPRNPSRGFGSAPSFSETAGHRGTVAPTFDRATAAHLTDVDDTPRIPSGLRGFGSAPSFSETAAHWGADAPTLDRTTAAHPTDIDDTPRIPSALRGFGSALSFFETAAHRGTVAETFECLVSKLDCAANRINDRATAAHLTDIDDTPIAVTFGGDASAFGAETTASAIMLGKAVDLGLVSYAIGTCSYTAAATATEGDTAVAVSNSFATVTGADLVITFTRSGSTDMTQGADLAYETSTTSFLAIDLEFWDSANGPIVIEYDWELCRLKLPTEIEDNTAVLDTLLELFGEGTFTQVDSAALTIEDTMSTATAVGTLVAA